MNAISQDDLEQLSKILFNKMMSFLSKDQNPDVILHTDTDSIVIIAEQTINNQEKLIIYNLKDKSDISQNILDSIFNHEIQIYLSFIINNNKYYITDIHAQFGLIDKNQLEIKPSILSLIIEELKNKQINSFIFVPLVVSKIIEDINNKIVINFLNELIHNLHIDDLTKMKENMMIDHNDKMYTFLTYPEISDENEFTSNIIINAQFEIEKNGFITKILNIKLDYNYVIKNIIPSNVITVPFNKDHKINKMLLNNNQFNNLNKINKMINISNIIVNSK